MERLKYYTVSTFDYGVIGRAKAQRRRVGNPGKRKDHQRVYKDLMCAFDIEVTNDYRIDQAFMYIWQFQIEGFTIIGRTWDEFKDHLKRMKKELSDEYLMIYVHNLSYEFSFLKGIYEFQDDELFAIDRRKVLKCTMMDSFEFRCSYMLTNMSLSLFTEKMGVERKLDGDEFDYSVIRYPWTILSEKELEYCIVDVRALVSALKVYYSLEGDTHYTIPLTSTGFVRRDVKRAMRRYNKKKLQSQFPDYDLYVLMRQAFRGGNTHANRYYSGQIIENVVSYDRVSSYPDVQINELFPIGEWIHEGSADIDRVARVIYKQKRAGIIRIRFSGIRLSDPLWGCPYIAIHKCLALGKHENDNGRVLYADYLEVVLTDIDFNIVLSEYDFEEATVLDFYHNTYGKLPYPLKGVIKDYFRQKTILKGEKGKEVFYNLQKAKLNSIFGMTCQKVVQQEMEYIDRVFEEKNENECELYNSALERAFLVYTYGVWTTARAREQLEIALNVVGASRFVYCDTDSVKFIDSPDIDFAEYNEEQKKKSAENGGVAKNKNGNTFYLGLFECEGKYDEFVTLGAKKYCYTDGSGLHLTVAGVGKKKGIDELNRSGGIRAFREGFVFHEAGGNESVYNDFPEMAEYYPADGGGRKIEIVSNVLIRPSTYTLGITGDYRRIIEMPDIWLDYFK